MLHFPSVSSKRGPALGYILWVLFLAGTIYRDETAFAAEPKDLLRESARASGHGPSLDDFVSVVNKFHPTNQNRHAIQEGWAVLRALQRPPISYSELNELLIAQRSMVSSIDCSVAWRREEFRTNKSHKLTVKSIRCAHIDGMYYLSEDIVGNSPTPDGLSVYAFDGKVYRQFFRPTGGGDPRGGILTLSSKDVFFPADTHPLCLLMMLDTSALFGRPNPPLDLPLYVDSIKEGLIIFEVPELVDGHPCLVLSTGAVKFLVDVSIGCVLRRLESYAFVKREGELKEERVLKERRDFQGFVDIGGGVVLPQLVLSESFDGELLKCRTTAKLTWQSVNVPIPVSVFENIIPKGTRVVNVENGTAYREGVPGSVESTLRDAIKGRARGIGMFWLVVINLFFLMLLGVVVFMSRRKAN